VAIAREVQDTKVFALPGGVQDGCLEVPGQCEGRRGDGYKLMLLWLFAILSLSDQAISKMTSTSEY
jgi:hypothetical protein